ncbi:MAG: alanine racemase [Rhizobiales bacterium]|nr:alanine racemase [Hyphomicrobiales bacterium]
MDDPSMAAGRLAIDLDALVANWRDMAQRAGSAETAGVVKGDAYGMGIEPVVAALSAAGCSTFFVALPAEGVRVRAVAPSAAVYVLAGLVGDAGAYVASGLRPVLNSADDIAAWQAARANGAPAGAALHVDTGMNRLGLRPDELGAMAAGPDLAASLGLTLVMSHLACADTPGHPLNRRQLETFRAVSRHFPGLPASLANSAGVFLGPDYGFDLVRPGIAVYGGRPVSEGANPMRPVATLEGLVLQVRTVPAGEAVGYGAAETVARETRVAVVGVGYADGYHRRAGATDARPGASGVLHGRRVPLVGRVSMDLMAFDVTDVPEAAHGDWIELFGSHVAVDDVAAYAETIGYELLTGLGRRYARTYSGGA